MTTYSNIQHGEYFTIQSPVTGRPVVFLQDNADQHWRTRLSPSNKSLKRPRPTRLFDGVFYSLDEDTPIEVTSKERAMELVNKRQARQASR